MNSIPSLPSGLGREYSQISMGDLDGMTSQLLLAAQQLSSLGDEFGNNSQRGPGARGSPRFDPHGRYGPGSFNSSAFRGLWHPPPEDGVAEAPVDLTAESAERTMEAQRGIGMASAPRRRYSDGMAQVSASTSNFASGRGQAMSARPADAASFAEDDGMAIDAEEHAHSEDDNMPSQRQQPFYPHRASFSPHSSARGFPAPARRPNRQGSQRYRRSQLPPERIVENIRANVPVEPVQLSAEALETTLRLESEAMLQLGESPRIRRRRAESRSHRAACLRCLHKSCDLHSARNIEPNWLTRHLA